MIAAKRFSVVTFAVVLALAVGGLAGAGAQTVQVPQPLPPPVDYLGDSAQGLSDGLRLREPLTFSTKEVPNLATVIPFIQRWKEAIKRRDLAGSIQAGEDYERIWQGIEVYVNHRSLPLYTATEVDTQFAIEAGLQAAQPDWPRLSSLADRLGKLFSLATVLSAGSPALSPIFDDVAELRKVRANLLITSSALAATPPDLVKAKATFAAFKTGYPGVKGLISLRSTSAEQETSAALNAAAAKFDDPSATAADLAPLVATLLNRFNFGLSLSNAAARASDLHRTAVTDADKTLLTQLNDVALGLKRSLPKFPSDLPGAAAGGATGPGSAFAKVQPALESKTRFINTAATLRSSLAAYATLITSTPQPSVAAVQAANKAALEQVAIAQQVFVGQFWTDPGLQAFLASLPAT
ncbi:MAG: hypothetical protein ACRDZ4_12390 [Egibacteraceae bacterium]